MKKTMKMNVLLIMVVLSGFALFGATIDTTVGGDGFPANAGGERYVLKAVELDLSATTVASNDVVQVITIPDNAIVLAVSYEVSTACANGVTIDIGDGADPNGYVNNLSSTNTAGWVTSGISATLSGKLYTSADTIDLTFDDAPGATGKINVTVILIRGVRE